jgi:hypothetical protein
MNVSLVIQIEDFLLANPRWVPVRELEERFGIDERILRAQGRRRPLLAHCAISNAEPGNNGYKHIRHTTVRERLRAKHACRRRIIAGARADKDLKRAVAHALDGRFDKAGQGHLPV